MGNAQHGPPEKRRSLWPWGRESLGKQDSLPWHEKQACGKTSVTRSLCREMEAWLLRRHEGATRAGRVACSTLRKESGQKAGLSCASGPKGTASPWPPVPRADLDLPPGAIPGTRSNNPTEKRAVRCCLPPRCGSDVGGRGCAGERVETVPHSTPSQCTGRVQGSCRLLSPLVKALA